MLLQTHSGFDGEDRLSELMVKPKVMGYHRKSSLETTTMRYNRRNNLPIHSSQLLRAQ